MKKLIHKAINPIRIFLNDSRSTGVILLFCTAVSLVLANSYVSEWYGGLWHHELNYGISIPLPESLSGWVNNFLMAFFFLLAGMEIKRELLDGELSSFKRAVLPFGAALGGMIVPALIFISFNLTSGFEKGWGIPTATDIAFSLGIASLLGKRIPVSLKIFLMALAIIDDLGAIVVIALFYGGKINLFFLGIAAVIYLLLWACNYFKVKFGTLQVILSLALWYAIFNSGIEASIAGVLTAFALPLNVLPKIEKAIHRSVNFLILPLFALANTAILLPDNIIGSLSSPISLGIMAGLVLGKPVGIFLFSRLLVALNLAHLPSHVKWKHIIGMGSLAGIGFTMSIFTTTLAFGQEEYRNISKIAIILAMGVSIVISGVYFMILETKKIEAIKNDLIKSSKEELSIT